MAVYLFLTGAMFLIAGVRALLKPIETVAVPYSMQVDGIDGRNYLRSAAGGVTLATGGVIVAGAFFPTMDYAALLLCVTILGGLLFGRGFSCIVDGIPGPTPIIAAVFELVGLGFGVFWLIRFTA